MRRSLISISCVLCLAGAPAWAHDAPEDTPEDTPGLRGELEEMEQDVREAITDFSELIAPMLDTLGAMIGDLPEYEAPEILPNGDIIIRRKPSEAPSPEVPAEAGDDADDGVEL